MTAANPPFPNFTNIIFNSSYFSSNSSGGLTQTEADNRYLIKIEPDTASSSETFNGGIITQDIDTHLTSQNLNLGNTNYKTGTVNLGAGIGSTGIINVGALGTSTVNIHGNITLGDNTLTPLNLVGACRASSLISNNLNANSDVLYLGTNTTLTTATNIGSGTHPTTIYGNSITFSQSLTLANQVPTASTSQLGSLFTSPAFTWNTSAGVAIATTPTLPIGVYHFDFSVTTNGTFVYNFLYISPEDLQWRCPFIQIAASGTRSACATGSYTFSISTPKTMSLYVYAANANTLDYAEWNIYRIG